MTRAANNICNKTVESPAMNRSESLGNRQDKFLKRNQGLKVKLEDDPFVFQDRWKSCRKEATVTIQT